MGNWLETIVKAVQHAERNARLERDNALLNKSMQAMSNTITQIQAGSDILTWQDETTNKHYTGTPYTTYSAQVAALDKKYAGTADWGCLIVKNIIDVRAAFLIGRGVQVKQRDAFKENAERELTFIKEFLHYNALDKSKPGTWAVEGEIEGKVLLRIKPTTVFDERNRPKVQVKVWHVPWRKYGYTIAVDPPDYDIYKRAWYVGTDTVEKGPGNTITENVGFEVDENWFVYARFGGGQYDVNNCPSKTAFVLRQCEDLDKELWDWRKTNHLFAAPTPVIEYPAEMVDEARRTEAEIQKKNWRIGKTLVLAGGTFKLECFKGEGYTTLQKAVENDVQAISGATGVPVHFLGHPNLLSNRATAENLMELIQLSTDKERDVWQQVYTELFQKVIKLYNAVGNNNLNPNAVEAVVPFATKTNLQALEKVYLPMYAEGAISLEYLLSQLSDVDVEDEKERVLKAQAEKEAKEAEKEAARAKEMQNAAIFKSRIASNG